MYQSFFKLYQKELGLKGVAEKYETSEAVALFGAAFEAFTANAANWKLRAHLLQAFQAFLSALLPSLRSSNSHTLISALLPCCVTCAGQGVAQLAEKLTTAQFRSITCPLTEALFSLLLEAEASLLPTSCTEPLARALGALVASQLSVLARPLLLTGVRRLCSGPSTSHVRGAVATRLLASTQDLLVAALAQAQTGGKNRDKGDKRGQDGVAETGAGTGLGRAELLLVLVVLQEIRLGGRVDMRSLRRTARLVREINCAEEDGVVSILCGVHEAGAGAGGADTDAEADVYDTGADADTRGACAAVAAAAVHIQALRQTLRSGRSSSSISSSSRVPAGQELDLIFSLPALLFTTVTLLPSWAGSGVEEAFRSLLAEVGALASSLHSLAEVAAGAGAGADAVLAAWVKGLTRCGAVLARALKSRLRSSSGSISESGSAGADLVAALARVHVEAVVRALSKGGEGACAEANACRGGEAGSDRAGTGTEVEARAAEASAHAHRTGSLLRCVGLLLTSAPASLGVVASDTIAHLLVLASGLAYSLRVGCVAAAVGMGGAWGVGAGGAGVGGSGATAAEALSTCCQIASVLAGRALRLPFSAPLTGAAFALCVGCLRFASANAANANVPSAGARAGAKDCADLLHELGRLAVRALHHALSPLSPAAQGGSGNGCTAGAGTDGTDAGADAEHGGALLVSLLWACDVQGDVVLGQQLRVAVGSPLLQALGQAPTPAVSAPTPAPEPAEPAPANFVSRRGRGSGSGVRRGKQGHDKGEGAEAGAQEQGAVGGEQLLQTLVREVVRFLTPRDGAEQVGLGMCPGLGASASAEGKGTDDPDADTDADLDLACLLRAHVASLRHFSGAARLPVAQQAKVVRRLCALATLLASSSSSISAAGFVSGPGWAAVRAGWAYRVWVLLACWSRHVAAMETDQPELLEVSRRGSAHCSNSLSALGEVVQRLSEGRGCGGEDGSCAEAQVQLLSVCAIVAADTRSLQALLTAAGRTEDEVKLFNAAYLLARHALAPTEDAKASASASASFAGVGAGAPLALLSLVDDLRSQLALGLTLSGAYSRSELEGLRKCFAVRRLAPSPLHCARDAFALGCLLLLQGGDVAGRTALLREAGISPDQVEGGAFHQEHRQGQEQGQEPEQTLGPVALALTPASADQLQAWFLTLSKRVFAQASAHSRANGSGGRAGAGAAGSGGAHLAWLCVLCSRTLFFAFGAPIAAFPWARLAYTHTTAPDASAPASAAASTSASASASSLDVLRARCEALLLLAELQDHCGNLDGAAAYVVEAIAIAKGVGAAALGSVVSLHTVRIWYRAGSPRLVALVHDMLEHEGYGGYGVYGYGAAEQRDEQTQRARGAVRTLTRLFDLTQEQEDTCLEEVGAEELLTLHFRHIHRCWDVTVPTAPTVPTNPTSADDQGETGAVRSCVRYNCALSSELREALRVAESHADGELSGPVFCLPGLTHLPSASAADTAHAHADVGKGGLGCVELLGRLAAAGCFEGARDLRRSIALNLLRQPSSGCQQSSKGKGSKSGPSSKSGGHAGGNTRSDASFFSSSSAEAFRAFLAGAASCGVACESSAALDSCARKAGSGDGKSGGSGSSGASLASIGQAASCITAALQGDAGSSGAIRQSLDALLLHLRHLHSPHSPHASPDSSESSLPHSPSSTDSTNSTNIGVSLGTGGNGALCFLCLDRPSQALLLGRYDDTGALVLALPVGRLATTHLAAWDDLQTANKRILRQGLDATQVEKLSDKQKRSWWLARQRHDEQIESALSNFQDLLGPWRVLLGARGRVLSGGGEASLRELVARLWVQTQETEQGLEFSTELGAGLLRWVALVLSHLDASTASARSLVLSPAEAQCALGQVCCGLGAGTAHAEAFAAALVREGAGLYAGGGPGDGDGVGGADAGDPLLCASGLDIFPSAESQELAQAEEREQTYAALNSLKVMELRARLKDLGADAAGRKAELVERLMQRTLPSLAVSPVAGLKRTSSGGSEGSGSSSSGDGTGTIVGNGASARAGATSAGRGHVVLLLDEQLQRLPVECIPALRPHSLSRVPGFALLLRLISSATHTDTTHTADTATVVDALGERLGECRLTERGEAEELDEEKENLSNGRAGRKAPSEGKVTSEAIKRNSKNRSADAQDCQNSPGIPQGSRDSHDQGWRGVNVGRGWYALDVEGNLPATRASLQPFLTPYAQSWCWQGVDCVPSEQTARVLYESQELFIYCGHGSGEALYDSYKLRRLRSCPASFLWGCSSGRLRAQGVHDAAGPALYYLLAGAPFVLGNLWDVTDKDIDKLCMDCMARSLPMGTGGVVGETRTDVDHTGGGRVAGACQVVADALSAARDVCRMQHAVGSAPVVYGIPTHLG
ncbi:peptidase family C50-domain-containing protein [Ochromonadaceae sp. CCMP2298]|nr:peptidase family C50-domain-containing protein [Ochromonadaceae sp. CCMP2298]